QSRSGAVQCAAVTRRANWRTDVGERLGPFDLCCQCSSVCSNSLFESLPKTQRAAPLCVRLESDIGVFGDQLAANSVVRAQSTDNVGGGGDIDGIPCRCVCRKAIGNVSGTQRRASQTRIAQRKVYDRGHSPRATGDAGQQ